LCCSSGGSSMPGIVRARQFRDQGDSGPAWRQLPAPVFRNASTFLAGEAVTPRLGSEPVRDKGVRRAPGPARLRLPVCRAGELDLEAEQAVGPWPVALTGVEPVLDALPHPRLAPDLALPHATFLPTRASVLTTRWGSPRLADRDAVSLARPGGPHDCFREEGQ